jgi:TATA-binding protein-associated factor Taf7
LISIISNVFGQFVRRREEAANELSLSTSDSEGSAGDNQEDDEGEEAEDEPSEYERLRESNILRNSSVLNELGLGESNGRKKKPNGKKVCFPIRIC